MNEITGSIQLACTELHEVVIESDGLKTTYRASSPHAIRLLMQAVSEHRAGMPIEPQQSAHGWVLTEAQMHAMRSEEP